MFAQRSPQILFPAALLVCAAVVCAGCGEESNRPTDGNPVVVSVEVVPAAAVPGESVTLVWRFELADQWHLYWAGRNDSGYPPQVDLELPPGWLAGGLQWPAPERHLASGGILDHVYFEELILIQKLGAPAEALVGAKVEIKADVKWLACREMCVPGGKALVVEVPVVAQVQVPRPNSATLAAARLPGPLPENFIEARWEKATFHLGRSGARSLTFMPTEDCGRLVDLPADGQGESLALRFKPKGETVGPVRGLITIEQVSGETRTYRIDYPAVRIVAVSPGG